MSVLPPRGRPLSRAELLAAFHAAVEADCLDFHYQPMLDADRGVVGVEALMRCPDGAGGHLAAAELVSALGDEGLPELGRAAILNAVAQRRRWNEAGLPIRVSVNLLQEQVGDEAFVDWLLDDVAGTEIAPADLMLEVADSQPITTPSPVETGIKRLAAAGFPLALDSFGRGRSNLVHMRDLSFSMLKSDRAFGARLHADDGRQILEAMSGFARALDFEVIVVGVENAAGADNASRLGAAALQGFHYAPPMHAEECTAWLAANFRRASAAEA